MKGETKRTLTPRLRFPDFIGEPLRQLHLGDVTEDCTTRNGKGVIPAQIMGVSKTEGIIPMQERLIGKDTARYKCLETNWFAYNPMRINIGSIARWKGGGDVLVSPDYVVFRCITEREPSIDPNYLDIFRCSDQWENFVAGSGDGGVRIRIYYKDLARLPITLPTPAEQRKIAACLGSLDDWIGAEVRKLEALRSHKKGLMQQLFPRPGESRPRLRFAEFHNAGVWEEKPLGEIFETMTGGTPERTVKEYWNGSIPWVTTSLVDFNMIYEAEEFITEAGLENSSAKLFPKGTILMALYGQGKTRGKVAVLGIDATTNQACAAILPRDDFNTSFTFLSLCGRYDELRGMSNSGGQENLSQGLVRALPFRYPADPAEQRRIAACLSSLDDVLAAQARKVASLKSHKKGLMQQLFPASSQSA